MKRVVFVITVLIASVSVANAQSIAGAPTNVDEKLEVYTKEHITNKAPIPYAYVREADVMWSKTIYRMIDLRHKQNLALYYPTKRIGNRMSLIDLLLYGIKNEGLKAYDDPDVNADAATEFDVELSVPLEVDQRMDALPDTVPLYDQDGIQTGTEIVPGIPKSTQIKQIMVKEKWYFDKQHSVMKVRIVGICPIRLYKKPNSPNFTKQKTFWIYYPEARSLLSSHEVFNRHNDAQRVSFDDFFEQRRFNGFIWAEANVYDNRIIMLYKPGLQMMLEANRIEEEIFNMEHDQWVY
jgi:gliding motility associated protien GldN